MNRKKMKMRGLLAALTFMILFGGIFCEDAMLIVRAEAGNAFSIQAEMTPSDKETYSIRLTIENQGEDWEGTVRLTVDENYYIPSAYDTALSLPQGSRKQFVVKVPVNSIESSNGTVFVTLLDRKDNKIAEKEFKRLLTGEMEALSMGILSDAYSKLTYLDMGGRDIYFYNDLYPIKLVELKQGSLADELDALTFLVIDQYNTAILTEEELEAIELWNLNGGVLLIGTGAYAEDTLSGFDGGYLDISSGVVHTPGDEEFSEPDYMGNVYLDSSQLTIAELQISGYAYNNLNMDYYYGGWFESMGDGSVCIVPYSLAELGSLDESSWYIMPEDFVQGLIENVSNYAVSRYASSTSYYDDHDYDIRRLLGVIGNSNSILNFGVLKVLVIVYVIFVGPILYLILRLLKRRELYWVAVPITALLGIGMVYLAGRGFEVVSTKVYSVTMKNLSESGNTITYLHCYDANRSEWELRMADGCEYAGPFGDSYRYGSYENSYYYHIKKEGDTFFLGMKPETNFEDSYFYLSSSTYGNGVEGSLLIQDLLVDMGRVGGTVVNDTNKDISYFAVAWNDCRYVYEGLDAGASCRLEDLEPLYGTSGSSYYYGSYVYSFLSNYYDDREYGKVGTLAALAVGIDAAMAQADKDEFVVIGVVENWDKTVNDNCSEVSYGCLYSVQ
ncbi:MAG: hypothetical protein J1E83_14745 [Lachnospiraceae bacterium]|nr:hypothetical protein [Lachnospiraceae bacterium]